MGMIDPNSDNYEGAGTKRGTGRGKLPDGPHIVAMYEFECGRTPSKGTPYVEMVFQCIDPASKYLGQRLSYQSYYISGGATRRLVECVNAMHTSVGKKAPAFDPEDAEGMEAVLYDMPLVIKVQTREDTYKGKTRDRTEARFHDPISDAERARLTKAYGAKLVPDFDAPSDKPLDPLGGEAGTPTGGTFSDDEIPF